MPNDDGIYSQRMKYYRWTRITDSIQGIHVLSTNQQWTLAKAAQCLIGR